MGQQRLGIFFKISTANKFIWKNRMQRKNNSTSTSSNTATILLTQQEKKIP